MRAAASACHSAGRNTSATSTPSAPWQNSERRPHRPSARTAGGYGVFDAAALQRLCFVRAALEAGIGLDLLTRLCRALDTADGDEASAHLADLCHLVERRRQALTNLETQLTELAHSTSEISA